MLTGFSDTKIALMPTPLKFCTSSKNILQPSYASVISSPTNDTSSSRKYVFSGSYSPSTGLFAK